MYYLHSYTTVQVIQASLRMIPLLCTGETVNFRSTPVYSTMPKLFVH